MDIYVFINNERKSLRQLSAESGVAYETIYARWKNGVPADKLVELPEPEEPELPPTKEEVVNALGYTPGMVNPNLLDNWYFANPVNQRGQTEYTGSGYTIDRWQIMDSDRGSVKLEDGGISFSCTSPYAIVVKQFFPYEFWAPLVGKVVTHSALTDKGLYSSTITLPSDPTAHWDFHHMPLSDNWYLSVEGAPSHNSCGVRLFSGTEGATAKIIAAKLELGDTQTLAHLDDSGNWVLNEIPNYHEEWLKCIQSTADPDDGYANKVVATTDQTSSMELLWENATPTSSFATQTIAVDWTKYDIIIVITFYITSEQSVFSMTPLLPKTVKKRALLSAYGDYYRYCSLVDGGVNFESGSPNNGHVLPFQIYGIKGVL